MFACDAVLFLRACVSPCSSVVLLPNAYVSFYASKILLNGLIRVLKRYMKVSSCFNQWLLIIESCVKLLRRNLKDKNRRFSDLPSSVLWQWALPCNFVSSVVCFSQRFNCFVELLFPLYKTLFKTKGVINAKRKKKGKQTCTQRHLEIVRVRGTWELSVFNTTRIYSSGPPVFVFVSLLYLCIFLLTNFGT